MPHCEEAISQRILEAERRLSSKADSYSARFDLVHKSARAFGQALTNRANANRNGFFFDFENPGFEPAKESDCLAPKPFSGKLTLRHVRNRRGDVIVGKVRFIRISSYYIKGTGRRIWTKRMGKTYAPREFFVRIDSDSLANRISSCTQPAGVVQIPAVLVEQSSNQKETSEKAESSGESETHGKGASQMPTDISDAEVEQHTGDLKTAISGLDEICKKAIETYDALTSVEFYRKSDGKADNVKGAKNGDK
jgi:hypothetical protein